MVAVPKNYLSLGKPLDSYCTVKYGIYAFRWRILVVCVFNQLVSYNCSKSQSKYNQWLKDFLLGKCTVVHSPPFLCWFRPRNIEVIWMNCCSGWVMDNHLDQNVSQMFSDFECIIGVNLGTWICYLEDVLSLIWRCLDRFLLQALR